MSGEVNFPFDEYPSHMWPDQPIFDVAGMGTAAELRECLDESPISRESFDECRCTLLGIATKFGNVDTVRELLRRGAIPHGNDKGSETPAQLAVHWVEYPVFSLSTNESKDRRLEVLRLILDRVNDLNAINGQGMTLLGEAAQFGIVDSVRELIRRGAELDACDRDRGGEPPVKFAWDHEHREVFEMLVEAGADLDAPGWMGISTRLSMSRSEAGRRYLDPSVGEPAESTPCESEAPE